jgi:hypothetical protein
MESELWKRVDELLQSALEVDPERRDAFLFEACGGDTALLDEVKSLLTSHRRAGDFLETPAAEVAARAIATEEEPSLSRSREGQLISHYRILNLIGRGGMGTVWLAERCDGRFHGTGFPSAPALSISISPARGFMLNPQLGAEFTALLQRWADGDLVALERLTPIV